ncbi:MAG: hypothetical protein Ct9H90mP16_20390 [Candidatus Poseidoniales archaeon]|nr:MAG: hypothetical protein Ct9H90mP16_20390 [Candidatus Poseidoniales archaeon]
MTRRVRLERDTLWLSAADMAALLVGLAVHVVLTRAFTEGDYGRWVLLLDLFYVTATIVDLGLPTLIGRDGERLGFRSTRFGAPLHPNSGSLCSTNNCHRWIAWVVVGGRFNRLVDRIDYSCTLSLCSNSDLCSSSSLAGIGRIKARSTGFDLFDRGATAIGIVVAAAQFGAHPIALATATFLGPLSAMFIAIRLGEKRLSNIESGGRA